MRIAVSALVAGVFAWGPTASTAAAAPRPAPAKPPPAARKPGPPAPGRPAKPPEDPAAKARAAELQELDRQIAELTVKQANFAAVKLVRKALALQVKHTGPDSIQVVYRKQRLAALLGQINDTSGQIAIHKELLARAEREHGAESREVFDQLSLMVGPYLTSRHYDELDATQNRMLAIISKLDGKTSKAYASQLTAIGSLLSARNQYASAQQAYEESLKIHEALAKDDSELLAPVQDVARAYWYGNQRTKAIALFDRAIKISSKPGTPIMIRGSALWMVVELYHYGGRDDLARPVSKLAIDLYEKEIARLERDAPDDQTIASLLGTLGFAYRDGGDLVNAARVFEKVVAIDVKRNGFSGWATVLADIRRQQDRPREALALLESAQQAMRKLSPDAAVNYNTLIADVVRELGDYPRAERLLDEFLASFEKMFGRGHPSYGPAELSVATQEMALNKPVVAEAMLTHALELAEHELQQVLQTGTEADHAVYFTRNAYQLDMAVNFELRYAPRSGSAARLGLTTLLRRKGRVLDAAAAKLTTIRARLSPRDKELLDELASARAQLAKLTVAGPTATGDADFAKEVAGYEDRIQKLEIQIGQNSVAYRAASQPITLPAVQKAIPRDARLVEIVNFQPSDPSAGMRSNQVLPARRYAAYIVGRTGDPTLVDLGPAAEIDDAVEALREAVADPDNDRAPELGHALYTLTLGKIVPALGGASHVLIAPDGALNVVPFAALVDDRGNFLVKRYLFTYLTSGRDLLRLGIKTRGKGGGVMFADPAFDEATPTPPASAPTTRGQRSADLTLQTWKPLPGTAQEADAVGKHMRGLRVYRGADATETQLKSVHGPKVLHLATHGFFLRDTAPPSPAPETSAVPAPFSSLQLALDMHENPLLRSGLALAGANQLKSGDDDGILTAMEATGLDLWGTQLVVLSACETGVGKVTNGEGVYGLRRALVIAGAESLLMSLWQVDDAATRDLMAGYYARLAAGAPRSSALRDVQLEIQRTPKYAHPYYWASFLSAGDNTPLQ